MKKIKIARSTIQSIEMIKDFIEAITKSEFPDKEMQALMDVTGMMVSMPLAEISMFIDSLENALDNSSDGIVVVEEVDMNNEDEKASYYKPISKSISSKDMLNLIMMSADPNQYLKGKGVDTSFLEKDVKSPKFSEPERIPTEEEKMNDFLDQMLKNRDNE